MTECCHVFSAFQFDYKWKQALGVITGVTGNSTAPLSSKSFRLLDRMLALKETREGYREWDKLKVEWGDLELFEEEAM